MNTIKIPLTIDDTLHVYIEADEMTMTLHSPGCSPMTMQSVEQAVEQTFPHHGLALNLFKTKQIIDQIVAQLSTQLTQ